MKKYMLLTAIIYSVFTVCITAACNKCNCFDQALKDKFSTIACTKDCPSVIGCDGKKYCNECLANKEGIAVK